MCGRYNIETDPRAWIDAFTVLIDHLRAGEWIPRYNVAPSQYVPVIRTKGDRWELINMRWGYVPGFIKEEKPKIQPINARADKLDISGFYRQSFHRRRCLLPATGFYEWQKRGGGKIPYHIQLPGREPFLFGGIWDTWNDLDTVAIITTEPNEWVKKIHNRMPLIVPREHAAQWLDGENPEDFLKPSDLKLEAYRVSTNVNNPNNDGPELLDKVPDDNRDH